MRRTSRWAAAACAVLVTYVATPGPAGASREPAGDPPTQAADPRLTTTGPGDPYADLPADLRALVLAQEPAAAAAGRLADEVEDLPGYAGVSLDGTAIELRWKGAPPAAARGAADRAGPVRVLPARYSTAELTAAAARVTAEIRAGRGGGVHSVVVPADGSGLRLGVDVAEPVRSASGVRPPHQLATGLLATARVSVPATVSAEPRISLLSRENDFPPWAGGAVIRDVDTGSAFNGMTCTTGFGVRDSANVPYILTAAHCGEYYDPFRDPTGEWVGRALVRNQAKDILLIPAQVAGEIYVGGPPGRAQGIRGVAGRTRIVAGQYLCHSGAYTGETCGLQAAGSMSETKCDFDAAGRIVCWEWLGRAVRTNGLRAARPGDSGGPVYVPSGGRVLAGGTITGGDGGRTVWFAHINTAVSQFGLTVLTRSS